MNITGTVKERDMTSSACPLIFQLCFEPFHFISLLDSWQLVIFSVEWTPLHFGPSVSPIFSYSPSDSESVLTDAAEGGLGGRGFGVGGDILFLPMNSTYVPGKSPFS